MSGRKGQQPPKKIFVGAEAVLQELDRQSDPDSDSDASFDSVREAAFIDGKDIDVDDVSSSDEDWLPPKKPRISSRAPGPSPTSSDATPGPSTSRFALPTSTPTPTCGLRRGSSRGRARTSFATRGRSAPRTADAFDEECWNDVTHEDERPVQAHFMPKRSPGPQLLRSATYSPLELFQLFFTTTVMDTIIKNTNCYASERAEGGKKFHWTPLVLKDLFTFIGIVIYMGLVEAKHIVDYWSPQKVRKG